MNSTLKAGPVLRAVMAWPRNLPWIPDLSSPPSHRLLQRLYEKCFGSNTRQLLHMSLQVLLERQSTAKPHSVQCVCVASCLRCGPYRQHGSPSFCSCTRRQPWPHTNSTTHGMFSALCLLLVSSLTPLRFSFCYYCIHHVCNLFLMRTSRYNGISAAHWPCDLDHLCRA